MSVVSPARTTRLFEHAGEQIDQCGGGLELPATSRCDVLDATSDPTGTEVRAGAELNHERAAVLQFPHRRSRIPSTTPYGHHVAVMLRSCFGNGFQQADDVRPLSARSA